MKNRNSLWCFLLLCFFMSGMVTTVHGEVTTEDSMTESLIRECSDDTEEKGQYTIELKDTLTEQNTILSGASGEMVTLPMPEKIEGYRSIGWSSDEDASEAEYVGDSSCELKENLILYPVRAKEYQVTFFTNTGKTTERLEKLTIVGIKGETVELPKLPTYNGYTSFGWTTQLNGKKVTHTEGVSFTIEQDAAFYQINGHVVTFYNRAGTGTFAITPLTTVGNAYVTLPKLPEKMGYQSIGWAKKPNSKVADFKEGSRVFVRNSLPLYAVYQKVPVYTVKFYTYLGGYEYKTYAMSANKGTTITLPKLPRVLGYANVGWGMVKGAAANQVKKAGTKITVTKNLKFYIYRKAAKTVQFMYNKGTGEYKSLRMDVTSDTVSLPNMKSPSGYQFLGWSDKPNQSSYPKYQVGEKLTVKKGIKLYAVLIKTPLQDIVDEELLLSQAYDTIYFIGDSRTVHMRKTVQSALGVNAEKLRFHCREKQGITWLRTEKEDILKEIKALSGKTAVVFNLGVNSLKDGMNVTSMARQYADLMNEMAACLKTKNCKFFFMSINPVNPKECTNEAYKRQPENIRSFNTLLRKSLKNYAYIDTYQYLINTGFELKDGIHYTNTTYRKIYNYAIMKIG